MLIKSIPGTIFKYLKPKTITLTRKRDESWPYFLDQLKEDNICIFMPEGQMKRKNGLDKHGNPCRLKLVYMSFLKSLEVKKLP